MRRDQISIKEDPDSLWISFDPNLLSHVADRNRVTVCTKANRRKGIHTGIYRFRSFKSVTRQRMKFRSFLKETLRHSPVSASYSMRTVLIAPFKEQFIEFVHTVYMWHRYHDIASGPSNQTFYQTFFVTFRRIAENRIETVMRSQSCISFLLFRVSSKAVFDSDPGVIKNDFRRCAAENLEGSYESIQKAFFILTMISKDNRAAAVTQSGTKQMDTFSGAADVCECFAPVDLQSFAGIKFQRDKCFWNDSFQFSDFTSDGRFSTGEAFFFDKPIINTFCRVLLLFQAFLFILLQTGTDK